MDAQKFTQKTLEALKSAQNIAIENNNMQITPEHLFYAMLDDEGGLIPNVIEKMGISHDSVLSAVDEAIRKIPGVTGSGREPDKIYVSPETDRIMAAAEKEAARLKDEYVSVEHVLLAMFDHPTSALREIFRLYGLTREGFLAELKNVKTNRVTSDNPEQTYEALAKYGTDLVERPGNPTWIPSSGGTPRSATSSASCPARPRTTRS